MAVKKAPAFYEGSTSMDFPKCFTQYNTRLAFCRYEHVTIIWAYLDDLSYSHIAMTDCNWVGATFNSKVFANALVCADSRRRWMGRPTFGSASRALAEAGMIQRFGSISSNYTTVDPKQVAEIAHEILWFVSFLDWDRTLY